MSYDPDEHTGRLRRLDAAFYRGHAWVHWTMTLDKRQTGWLDNPAHLSIREALIHTCARHGVICPVYCLMPDHGHFLLGGLRDDSDQRSAVRFFRTAWNRQLARVGSAFHLQLQSYDHVLRGSELQRGAFQAVAWYILTNPERARLSDDFQQWPCLGSIAAGYPDLDPRDCEPAVFWEKFWKIYDRERTEV